MWFFLSFYLSVVGFLLSSVPEPFHSHLWVGVGWEEGEGLELGIDIISRQLSKLWWCANQSVLTSSLFSYSLSFHIPVFRFAIVKFVVKIFLHYLILLNPSVSSDSTSLLSSPPPPPLLSSPPPPPLSTPNPRDFRFWRTLGTTSWPLPETYICVWVRLGKKLLRVVIMLHAVIVQQRLLQLGQTIKSLEVNYIF